MRYAISATGLATLVIAFTGAALPAKAQQRVAQPATGVQNQRGGPGANRYAVAER